MLLSKRGKEGGTERNYIDTKRKREVRERGARERLREATKVERQREGEREGRGNE